MLEIREYLSDPTFDPDLYFNEMSPAENSTSNYVVVTWDLDTTGRRLIDEICQIGGYQSHPSGEGDGDKEEGSVYSQYVMPYRNPNPGARRSFGIRVVNIGRYRMLKDLESGKILKTKSEISAISGFIDWLSQEKKDSTNNPNVLLVCHEANRKVLIPLLLESLYKFNLMDSFKKVVKGFVNSVYLVEKYGDKSKITSNSLRSLCKTVCNDTNPKTNSASDRSQVLYNVLKGIAESNKEDLSTLVHSCSSTVQEEEQSLQALKSILGTQGTLRPIFEDRLRQKRMVRERAMLLRKCVASSGLNYQDLKNIYDKDDDEKSRIEILKKKIRSNEEVEVSPDMMDELIELLNTHFITSNNNEEVVSADAAQAEDNSVKSS